MAKPRPKKKAPSSEIARGEPLRVNERTVSRNGAKVSAMVTRMNKDVRDSVMELFKSDLARQYTAMDASISSQANMLINKKADKWNRIFKRFSRDFSEDMVDSMNKSSANDLKRSLKAINESMIIDASSMSQRTKDIAKASVEQSASAIKTISSSYMSSVKESIMYSITSSSSSFSSLKDSIDSALKGKYKTHKNKAKNLAMEQTRDTYNALGTSRMIDAGLDEYEWLHTGGTKEPRHYHKYVLNGQTFKLSNPPIIDKKTGKRGNPGDDYGCHCVKVPIFKFS